MIVPAEFVEIRAGDFVSRLRIRRLIQIVLASVMRKAFPQIPLAQ